MENENNKKALIISILCIVGVLIGLITTILARTPYNINIIYNVIVIMFVIFFMYIMSISKIFYNSFKFNKIDDEKNSNKEYLNNIGFWGGIIFLFFIFIWFFEVVSRKSNMIEPHFILFVLTFIFGCIYFLNNINPFNSEKTIKTIKTILEFILMALIFIWVTLLFGKLTENNESAQGFIISIILISFIPYILDIFKDKLGINKYIQGIYFIKNIIIYFLIFIWLMVGLSPTVANNPIGQGFIYTIFPILFIMPFLYVGYNYYKNKNASTNN